MNRSALHLSEDALDEVLIGVASPTDNAHMASCAVCSARLTEFRSSLAVFREASTAWSQARSNSISRELPSRRSSVGPASAWSLGTATALAVALAVATGIHRDRPVTSGTSSTSGVSQQEIASDNAMLAAIDSAISRPTSPPVEIDSKARPSRYASSSETQN